MKRRLSAFLLSTILIVSMFSGFTLSAGAENAASVTGIEVVKLPNKTEYKYGNDVEIVNYLHTFDFEDIFEYRYRPCSVPINGISTEGMQICINYIDGTNEIVTVDSDGCYTKKDGSTGLVKTECADYTQKPKFTGKSGQFDVELFAEGCSTHFNVDIVAGNFLVMLRCILLYGDCLCAACAELCRSTSETAREQICFAVSVACFQLRLRNIADIVARFCAGGVNCDVRKVVPRSVSHEKLSRQNSLRLL